MPVTFIIGRAGSGKTRWCFDRLVNAMGSDALGPPLYWILPRQATFQAERDLTCLSGLEGFCRTRVLSFQQLGRELLARAGGAAVPEIDDQGRQMILGHLLRQHEPQLRYFGAVARRPGLAAEIHATFCELERCGRTGQDLADLLARQPGADVPLKQQALRDKLHDLDLLYRGYEQFLGQERIDPHRRLDQIIAAIEQTAALAAAEVYIDGFADFSDFEARILLALARRCRQVHITLLMDPAAPLLSNPHRLPHELDLFHRTQRTYRRLWFLFQEKVPVESPVLLDRVHRFQAPVLQQLERHFSPAAVSGERSVVSGDSARRDHSPATTHPSPIDLIEAPTRRAEVDAAARWVRRQLADGLRLRDIAILTRDLTGYHELIQASFTEHQIPHFLDRRRSAAHHPLLRLLRGALQSAAGNCPTAAVLALARSGLAGLSLDEVDELENYVLMHRIGGAAWTQAEPWRFSRILTRAEDEDDALPPPAEAELKRVDGYRRRLIDPLLPFMRALAGIAPPGRGAGAAPAPAKEREPAPLRDIARALFELLQHYKVAQKLSQWMDVAERHNRLEEQAEHQQVWNETIALLDQLVDLLGDAPVSGERFIEILETGLAQFDLALAPPAVDQVLIGQVDRARLPQVEAVLLLGLNDGLFPLVPREDTVFSDQERRQLGSLDLDLDPDSQRRLLDENLFGYIAVTRASHRLCLMRSLADDAGRPLGPSIFWRHLRELLPDAPVTTIGREETQSPAAIGTTRQLAAALMQRLRQDRLDADWACLQSWLSGAQRSSPDPVIARAFAALAYTNEAALSPEVAAGLFSPPLHASVTRIESFATCPFRHFARYGLRLQPREEPDVTALDLGNVFHQILERLVRRMIQQKQDWPPAGDAGADAAIRECAREVGQALRGELLLSSARNRYLLQHIEKTVAQVIASQHAASQRWGFRPAFAELGFGVEGAALPPFEIRTPGGHPLLLYGKIDRVDLIEDGSAFAVFDYKLTGNPLALDRVYHGIALQLLTYLLVIQGSGEKLVGRPITPAAAFYLRLLRRLDNVRHPDEAPGPDDELFHLKTKPRGVFDARYLEALDGELAGGSSDVVQAFVKKDGTLGNRNNTDSAEPHEFAALLEHVRRRLGELADQVVAGRIEARPYRIGQVTPCPHCELRPVCRFDPSINRYQHLPAMKREQVLERLAESPQH